VDTENMTSENDSGVTDLLPCPEFDSLAMKWQRETILGKVFEDERATMFGNYVILHELGHGGMGVVYAARDPRLGRMVAIKKLHGRGDSRLQGRLLQEAQVMAKLAHPNVVVVHEIGEAEGTTFIVMEYIEGWTLRQWLAQKRRSCTEILAVFEEAALGLIVAHEKGVVHRDFKPDNLMLGCDNRVRVMDFGLARPNHANEAAPLDSDLEQAVGQHTQSGALLGTLPYMAPEQLRGCSASASSDQFAFCVALYEALYGKRPFDGRTPEEQLLAIERGDVHELPKNPAVPAWLYEIVVRGLKFHPQDRFESMQALRDAMVTGQLEYSVVLYQALHGKRPFIPSEYVYVANQPCSCPLREVRTTIILCAAGILLALLGLQ
jgi:serine/threonine protein kinase